MKSDKRFLRQCISCREYKEKQDLIRITKNYQTGKAEINSDNKIQGRSIYVCKNEDCIKKLAKNKKTQNVLKAELTENIKVELSTVLPN